MMAREPIVGTFLSRFFKTREIRNHFPRLNWKSLFLLLASGSSIHMDCISLSCMWMICGRRWVFGMNWLRRSGTLTAIAVTSAFFSSNKASDVSV